MHGTLFLSKSSGYFVWAAIMICDFPTMFRTVGTNGIEKSAERMQKATVEVGPGAEEITYTIHIS